MRHLLLSLSLFLTPFIPALAQSYNNEIFRRIQRVTSDSLDASLCAEYIANAQREIALGRLHLDYSILSSTIDNNSTFQEILARQYGITAIFANGGDFVPHETACYNECMTAAIESRFGRGVVRRVALRADSLNSLGKGFRNAHPAGVVKAEDLFIQHFSYKSDFRKNRELQVAISFDIDSRGQFSNLRLQRCATGTGPMLQFAPLPTIHRYYTEVRRILRSRRWQVATLEAQPVTATLYVRLEYHHFFPNTPF
ncbi:hypothetical protein [Hymenobacter sp. BT190]|uniref:hypothetical protein n=1 Tax=Hymenobacter sp. BT190 TaxID=2763505 RepID=UPI0016513041|nr:hypothetical protein [Hymenobacter sp. BT190]MBC6697572.1 hypothetical protein [Hymenobacter sp. BT190]